MTLAILLLPCVSSTTCPGSDEDCDVTLASTDGVLHSAHMRVLVAHSGFFPSVLEELGPDAVVYLRGMDSRDLTSVLDLLYLGRATVSTSRVEQVARWLEKLQVYGLKIQKDDALEVKSSSSNTHVNDFDWSNSATASEEETVEEEKLGHKKKSTNQKKVFSKKSNLVSTLTPSPQLKEDLPGQTFSLGPEDMVALKQLWGKLVTVNKNNRVNGRDQKLVFSCKECGKESACRWNAYNHVDYHHLPDVQHKCDNCRRVFSMHRSLKLHVKTKHFVKVKDSIEDEKLPCGLAAGQFKCEAGCRNRDRGKREGFKYEISRILHYMKVHQQPKECCGATFLEHTIFRKHWQKEHHNFQCLTCAKTFYTKGEMKRHQKREHETKPQKCSVCPAVVKKLKKHMKDCHTGKLMTCSTCPYNSRSKHTIESHYRKVHTELDVEICNVCGDRFKYLKKHMANTKCGMGKKAEATIPC